VLVRRRTTTTKEADVKYALLIYGKPGVWENLSDDERSTMYEEYAAVTATPGISAGVELESVDTATTVRVENGETLTTDGPFAETKELLGGLYLFEADNLDDAIAVAARIPAARHGSIEVRPVVER
jgi:hypothetical protein